MGLMTPHSLAAATRFFSSTFFFLLRFFLLPFVCGIERNQKLAAVLMCVQLNISFKVSCLVKKCLEIRKEIHFDKTVFFNLTFYVLGGIPET